MRSATESRMSGGRDRYRTVLTTVRRRGHHGSMRRGLGTRAAGPGLARLAVIALAATLLTACAAEPEPDPTSVSDGQAEPSPSTEPDVAPSPEPTEPPDILDLVLTTEGLGTLRFGDAIEGAPTDMIVWDPEFCTDARTGQPFGIAPGDEFAGLWVPLEVYGEWKSGYSEAPFGAAVEGSTPIRIDLIGGVLATDAGIRLGSTDDEVLAAYPGAAVLEEGLSDIVVVEGTSGRLLIEIARERDIPGYWDASQRDHVLSVVAVATSIPPFARAGTDNWIGGCPV